MKLFKIQWLFVYLLLCNCALAASLTKVDLVGTYRLDVTGAEDLETVPTNFYKIILILNSDGSFQTTNASEKFFFDFPSGKLDVTHGTWGLRHDSDYGVDYVDVTFSKADQTGSWSMPVEAYQGVPRIRIHYKPFKDLDMSLHVYFKRQK